MKAFNTEFASAIALHSDSRIVHIIDNSTAMQDDDCLKTVRLLGLGIGH